MYVTPFADMVVTYTDGFEETLGGVRFQVAMSDPNPVKYANGVLTVENCADEVLYRVGVRGWVFVHPEPPRINSNPDLWWTLKDSDEPPF